MTFSKLIPGNTAAFVMAKGFLLSLAVRTLKPPATGNLRSPLLGTDKFDANSARGMMSSVLPLQSTRFRWGPA